MPRKQQNNAIQCQHFIWKLFQRKDVWYADGRSGELDLGKHSLGTRDKLEAEKALQQLDHVKAVEFGLIKSVDTSQSFGKDVSFEKGLQLFYQNCSKDPLLGGVTLSTIKRYRAVSNKFVEFCIQKNKRHWEEVNCKVFEAYATWLRYKKMNKRRNYSNRTIAFELTVLRTINIFLCREKHISESCRISIAIPKFDESDRYCYRKEEVEKMLGLCFAQDDLKWLGQLLSTLAATGIRIGEAAQLRWSDIDFENDIIHIRDERSNTRKQLAGIARSTKGKRSRTIPIHSGLKKILIPMSRHRDGYVFHGPRGGRLKPDTARNVLLRYVITPLKEQFPTPDGETGFEHGRLHSFRHYFVSECCRQGIPEARIMDWVGHRDSKILARYRHLRPEDGQEQMKGLDLISVNEPNDDEPNKGSTFKKSEGLEITGYNTGVSMSLQPNDVEQMDNGCPSLYLKLKSGDV